MSEAKLGGRFTFPGTSLTVQRMGYGAMQLAGPGVWGPPTDPAAALAVLREAVAAGVNHIDTSDYYGPHITNQIIKEALYPYPDELRIVTKVGAKRDAQGGWPHARSPQELRQAVHDNLKNLGLDALDVVNLRVGGLNSPEPGSIAEPSASPTYLGRFLWPRCAEGGWWAPAVKAGDTVKQGQVIGTVSSLDGAIVKETVTAPADGVVIFVTSSPAVAEDGLLLGLGAA